MIRAFKNKTATDIFNGENSKASRKVPKELHNVAQRKLDMLNAASEINDLRIPPSNRLERLKGDLKDYYSIRVNDQWRITFIWKDGDVFDVQIVDYHS